MVSWFALEMPIWARFASDCVVSLPLLLFTTKNSCGVAAFECENAGNWEVPEPPEVKYNAPSPTIIMIPRPKRIFTIGNPAAVFCTGGLGIAFWPVGFSLLAFLGMVP
jgi:hypothetical protein